MVDVVGHSLGAVVEQALARHLIQGIRPPFAAVDQQHRADDIYDVVRGQDVQGGPFRLAQAHIELVAAYFAQVVAAAVKEMAVEQVLGVFQAGRLPGAHFAVKVNLRGGDAPDRGRIIGGGISQRSVGRLVGMPPAQHRVPGIPQILLPENGQFPILEFPIPIQGVADVAVAAIGIRFRGGNGFKEGQDFLVRGVAQGPQESGGRNFALAVDFYRQHIPGAGLKLQPGPPGGDYLGGPLVFLGGAVVLEIDAGGAHQLADHHPFRAVDDKGGVVGHLGDVPHKDVLFLDLAGVFHHQLGLDNQRLGVGDFPLLALGRAVLGGAEVVFPEVQFVLLAGVVGDGRNFLEHGAQPVAPEPFEGFELALDQVGHLQHLGDAGIGFDRGRRGAMAVAFAIAVGAGGKLPVRDGSNGHAPISLCGCRLRRRGGKDRLNFGQKGAWVGKGFGKGKNMLAA